MVQEYPNLAKEVEKEGLMLSKIIGKWKCFEKNGEWRGCAFSRCFLGSIIHFIGK